MNFGRPGRTVISSRLINGIICQAGESKNINLSRVTAIKRLWGTKAAGRSRGWLDGVRGGERRLVETELAI